MSSIDLLKGVILSLMIAFFATGCTSKPETHIAFSADGEFMLGCWINDKKTMKEVWTRTSSAKLEGIGFRVSGAEERETERMIIDLSPQIAFRAQPNGQSETRFTAIDADQNSFGFLNAEHDYPQLITYARQGDTLVATISLFDGSNRREFRYSLCY